MEGTSWAVTQTLEGEKNTTEFDQSKEFMIGSTKKFFKKK